MNRFKPKTERKNWGFLDVRPLKLTEMAEWLKDRSLVKANTPPPEELIQRILCSLYYLNIETLALPALDIAAKVIDLIAVEKDWPIEYVILKVLGGEKPLE
jgi:hypothetical protein